VTFKAVKEGKATVSFTNASVLAADGKGTDIAGAKNTATYDIVLSQKPDTPKVDEQPPVETGDSTLIPKPDEPQITSSTHPEEGKWYNSPKAKFTWDLPPDVMVVRLALDKEEKTNPTTNYDPAISEKEFDSLENGVMYFHLKYKNDGGWGPPSHKKILIDKDVPPAFTLDAVDPKEGGTVTLKFAATDTLSGLDHYEVSVDGSNPLKVSINEVRESGYNLTDQLPGDHDVSVKAFDKAGNFTEAQAKFLIPGVIASAAANAANDEPKPTDWKLIGIIILAALSGFLGGYVMYERGAFKREKYVTKREADEVRDNVSNVFAALREEVGEQAGLLFQKPNPSALDREVMMRVNEALDLSEELISKEVEDVRKLLM
jgi:hypothetical protein